MKKLLLITALALASVSGYSQNVLQLVMDSAVTNGAVGGGYWHSTSGSYNIVNGDFIYNVTKSDSVLGAGLIVGYDYLWGNGKGNHVWNDVKGGFQLTSTFYPLKSLGYTNFLVKVFGGDTLANPHGSKTTGVGNIVFTGVDHSWTIYKHLDFHLDPMYQNRSGQAQWSRNYIGINGFLSLGF